MVMCIIASGRQERKFLKIALDTNDAKGNF